MKPFHTLPTFLPALFLMACGSITPAGLIAVSRLDPLTTPPGDVQLAISVPDTVRLADDGAGLRITYSEEDHRLVDTQALLTISEAAPEGDALRQPGETLYVGRLDAAAAKAFEAAQTEIRRLRAAGSTGTGSLQVNVSGGCRLGPPLEDMPVSTWIRTAPDTGFVQLTRKVDV